MLAIEGTMNDAHATSVLPATFCTPDAVDSHLRETEEFLSFEPRFRAGHAAYQEWEATWNQFASRVCRSLVAYDASGTSNVAA